MCSAGVCLALNLFVDLVFSSIGSRGPKLASPAGFFLPEQMAFVCDPFHTLEDRQGQGGMRRQAGGPHSEPLGGVEGGGGGLNWRSRGFRTGCEEQAVAAAAHAEKTLAPTSADQYVICHVHRAAERESGGQIRCASAQGL